MKANQWPSDENALRVTEYGFRFTLDTEVWATSLWYEYCEPFVHVVGFDKEEVEKLALKLAEDEVMNGEDQGEYAICGGVAYTYQLKDMISASDKEHLRELAEDGITVL
jgi:hypothetical protein